MASEKISDMTAASSVADADIFPIVQAGNNKSSAMSLLKTYLTGFFSKFSFKTISVSGQSDVVADSDSDTLTLAAGTGVTLTTNARTDTVTIAASVGALIDDTAFASSWNGVTTVAPSKNAVYDELHKIDTADDGTIVNAGTGFRIAGAAASGKILVGDGTNYVASTPTFPNASATTSKVIKSDGTNWVASTETYAAPSTTGKIMVSDGTNWVSSTVSGSGATATMSSAGLLTLSSIANATLSNSAITIAGTSTALGGSITLDTIDNGVSSVGLINRSGANTRTIVTAPSGAIVGTTDTQTLTNKRVTKRVTSTSGPGATPTINTDKYRDAVHFTAVAAAITSMTTNLSGTPVQGDMLRIDFTDDGTARGITWGTSFEASTVALPTTTVISTRLDVGFVWNTVSTKWRCVAVA